MSTRVKICGLTRIEDAVRAAELGASAVGFVFWPGSPRVVDPLAARLIARALPPFVTRVGVFVDASPHDVARIARDVGLDAVQLHGDEAIEAYQTVPARLIKAVTLESADDVDRAAALPPHVTPLVDAADRARRGGTGQTADWTRAALLSAQRPVVLAGGLTADNVTAAVQQVRPWAVDVSSGVESAPGVKSPERLAAFFAAVAAGVEGS